MGNTAITDAAESLAQNNPSGLENEAIKTDKGAELVEVSINVQKASFQHKMTLKRNAEEIPGKDKGKTILVISCIIVAPSICDCLLYTSDAADE